MENSSKMLFIFSYSFSFLVVDHTAKHSLYKVDVETMYTLFHLRLKNKRYPLL